MEFDTKKFENYSHISRLKTVMWWMIRLSWSMVVCHQTVKLQSVKKLWKLRHKMSKLKGYRVRIWW